MLTTATAASLVTLTTYGIPSAVGGSPTPQVWTTEEVEARLPSPSVILGGATGIYRSKKKRRFRPLIHHKEGTLCQHATTKWLFPLCQTGSLAPALHSHTNYLQFSNKY